MSFGHGQNEAGGTGACCTRMELGSGAGGVEWYGLGGKLVGRTVSVLEHVMVT